MVGNILAGLIGVTCTQLLPDLTSAFSVAGWVSHFMMMTTDSLHPPSGAVAITAVLGGDAVHRLGFHFYFVSCITELNFTFVDCCLFQSF